jgi:hypothetical protein
MLDCPDVISKSPPDPLLPDPTVIEIAPPPPDTPVPEPMLMEPLLPDVEEPVLNTIEPLTPDEPALAEEILISPLDVDDAPDGDADDVVDGSDKLLRIVC